MKRIVFALAVLAAVRAVPAAAQADPVPQVIGSFQYLQIKDPITDEDVSQVGVPEQGAGFMPSVLYWRCEKGGGYSVLVDGHLFAITQTVSVTWRFDQQPPQNADWTVAATQYAFLAEGQDAFTAAAAHAQRLALRVTVRDQEKTFLFPLNGAAAALSKLPCLASVAAPAAQKN